MSGASRKVGAWPYRVGDLGVAGRKLPRIVVNHIAAIQSAAYPESINVGPNWELRNMFAPSQIADMPGIQHR